MGSVSGPSLFLLYINDFWETFNCSFVYTGADTNQDVKNFQRDLWQLEQYSKKLRTSLKVDKRQIACFTEITLGINPLSYTLNDRTLAVVDVSKYLGLDVQDNFSLDTHIDRMSSRVCQRLCMIKRVLLLAPKEVRKLEFTTLCRCIRK